MVFNDLGAKPIKRFSTFVAVTLALLLTPGVNAQSSPAKVQPSGASKQAVSKPPVRPSAQANRQAQPSKQRVQAAQQRAPRPQARPTQQRQTAAAQAPRRVSVGRSMGLHSVNDPLSLSAGVVLVIDQNTNEVLFSKNDGAVLPIASLTKLMTGLVLADAQLPMNETITITRADIDTLKGSRSRLAVGSRLTRGEMLHVSLMSSENRAAHALGRTYPGGIQQFVRAMNHKAAALGMSDSRFVDPTGLSSGNQSSARDLAILVSAAYNQPIMRKLSTSPGHRLAVGRQTLQYNNSNRLIRSDNWDIGLQKTGYISEAGRCLVMQATVAGREVIMVFLDSVSNVDRLRDAERVRHWMEAQERVSPTQSKHLPRG